jgi:hypothetical protein
MTFVRSIDRYGCPMSRSALTQGNNDRQSIEKWRNSAMLYQDNDDNATGTTPNITIPPELDLLEGIFPAGAPGT